MRNLFVAFSLLMFSGSVLGQLFGPQNDLSMSTANARDVHTADLDGDGDMDVLSASPGDYKISWFENLGNGSFSAQNIVSNQMDRPVSVYASDLDEMYWAIEGKGAFQVVDGKNQRLEAKDFTMKDSGLKVVCSRSHLNEETQSFVNQLSNPELVATGSSLKFIIIAAGNAHVYPRLAPTMEWDTGAAQIILEEAGGAVIDHNTKKPLRYNKENLLNPFFIASGNES